MHGVALNPKAEQGDVDSFDEGKKQDVIRWLWLGVFALAAAGGLALLIALARTPIVQNLVDSQELFRVALVVHVDMSVLIWFLAVVGLMWSLLDQRASGLSRFGFGLTLLGTIMLSISPFVGADQPLMNNYVPVLQHPWFYLALTIIGLGTAVNAVAFLLSPVRKNDLLDFAMRLVAICVLLAIYCILAALFSIPANITGELFFELLFWGGGHVLQFAWTVLMLVAWVWLARLSSGQDVVGYRWGSLLFFLVVAPLFALPWLLRHPVDSRAYIEQFTLLMRWGGLGSVPLGALIFISLFRPHSRAPHLSAMRGALISSMVLFTAGGVLGFMISGSNTVVPAHYHGSIVGVTMACMGLIYYTLTRLGFSLALPRMARWQPYVYGCGQLLHITGLAWSGGYGVQRKVAGTAQALDGFQQFAAMGIMGLGGLISVIGGVFFLLVTTATLRSGMRGSFAFTSVAHPGVSAVRQVTP